MDAKKAQKLVKDYRKKNPVSIDGYVVLLDDEINKAAAVGRERLNIMHACRDARLVLPNADQFYELKDYYCKAGYTWHAANESLFIDWKLPD